MTPYPYQSAALRHTRRSIIAGVPASLLGLSSVAARIQVVSAQGGEVRIGYQKGSANLLVLKSKGLLDERLGDLGYTITWTEFPAGVVLLEALNAGSIDFGTTGAPPPIFAQAAGADLIYVLSSKPSPDTEAIIVLPDSPLQQAADLKGKKVAVAKGSSTNALLVHALEAGGLKWGDAEAVYLLPADAKAAFEGGSVDAWSIWDPYYAAEQAATEARPIVTNGSAGWLSRSYYLASRTFAAANQEALQIMEEAIADSEEWQSTHSPEVADLLAGETGLEPEILLKAEERRAFGVEPVTVEILAEQQELADLFFTIGMVPEKLDVSSAMLQS